MAPHIKPFDAKLARVRGVSQTVKIEFIGCTSHWVHHKGIYS